MFSFGQIPLGEIMNFLITLAMGQIVPLLLFYKYVFGIKLLKKVDMPLNKEIDKAYLDLS